MKANKVIASFMTVVMLFSFTACNSSSQEEIDYKSIFEKKGYEEIEKIEKDSFRHDTEGIYFSTSDAGQIEKIFSNTYYKKTKLQNVTSAFCACKKDDYEHIRIYSFTFDNDKDAKKLFNLYKDYLDDCELYDEDYGELKTKEYKNAFCLAMYDMRLMDYDEVFMEGDTTVTFIETQFTFSNHMWLDYEELYKEFGREFPTDLIDTQISDLYDYNDPTSETLDFYYD